MIEAQINVEESTDNDEKDVTADSIVTFLNEWLIVAGTYTSCSHDSFLAGYCSVTVYLSDYHLSQMQAISIYENVSSVITFCPRMLCVIILIP